MQRTVQAELLDRLPPQAPAALRSRRDLRVINTILRNRAWLRRTLAAHLHPGERVLELGAGDGSLALALRPDVPRCDGLDLCPRPSHWPAANGWHQVDVLNFAGWSSYPVVFGNLVLHHFREDALAELGANIRRHARVFVASEPARGRRYQWLFALLCPLIRANAVTAHDGRTSIAAGFVDDELPRLMGFSAPAWSWQVSTNPVGAYRLVAVRS